MEKNLKNFLLDFPALVAIWAIGLYQKTLSPDHGLIKGKFPYGYCRHYPSCSEYAKISISRFGLIKGLFLGSARILKCNPFIEPKVDLVPQKNLK